MHPLFVTLSTVLVPIGGTQTGTNFDFQMLALALAGVSLGGIGAILSGAFLFPEWASRAMKTYLPMVIIGVILVGVSGLILGALGGTP